VQSHSLLITSKRRTSPPSLGVLHQLAGRVEAQGLAVEHRCQELGRMVALDPAARVDQQREARRVTFREAVLREALDRLEDRLGELALVGKQPAPTR
jgi:hypothetical protein